MFDQLSDKLYSSFRKLTGQAVLTEANVRDALEDVKKSLLDADVNFKVVKEFLSRVEQKALGESVLKHVNPGQQFVSIVHKELADLLGGETAELNLKGKPPATIMMVGLQGSGKTTTSGKLAALLKKQKKSVLLVPSDIQRPAAVDQLKVLGKRIGVEVFNTDTAQPIEKTVKEAKDYAWRYAFDVMIYDTAGRLHVDEELMEQLKRVKSIVDPREVLLVADAMTGQDAVRVAESFNNAVGLTGVVLTKLDGDARGGAALSIRSVVSCPIKFAGVGEKMDQLEVFHPERIAGRILDKGDILTLVEKARETYDATSSARLEKRIRQNEFTIEDFLESLRQFRKMGSLEDTMKMIPGMSRALKQARQNQPQEKDLKRIEAIISSMTKAEREDHAILNGSRRERIAKGSGTTVQDVNKFVNQFVETRKLMKQFNKLGVKGIMRSGMLGGR